ncbi:MAG: ATP-dependent DNA ligase [Candidatus Thorarchaeota archaeon]
MKYVARDKNEWNSRCSKYKKEMNIKPLKIEEALYFRGNMIASIKYDGELTLIDYGYTEPGKVWLHNDGGRHRSDLPCTRELEDLFQSMGISKAIWYGELVALGKCGERMPFGQVSSIIQKPTREQEDQIHLFVFDVEDMRQEPYIDRLNKLKSMLSETLHVHVVEFYTVDAEGLKELWSDRVMKKQEEGLVIRTRMGIYKVKPERFFKLAVVGFAEGKNKNVGKLGNIVVAWVNPDGDLVYSCGVGGGFTDRQRERYWDLFHDYVIREIKGIFFIKPVFTARIKCTEVWRISTDKIIYEEGTVRLSTMIFPPKNYESFSMRFPSFEELIEEEPREETCGFPDIEDVAVPYCQEPGKGSPR